MLLMKTASVPSDPLSHLWREARAWLADLLADFVSPAHVARAVAAHARAAFRSRLQMLESLVMKLLLIEAARVPARLCKPMPAGSRRSPEAALLREGGFALAEPRSEDHRLPAGKTAAARAEGSKVAEHPDHPVTWRVRFHTPAQRPRRGTRASTAQRTPPARAPACAQTLALRLARRFEALRRVIADPRAAIAALARRLHALGAAAFAVARRIALWRPRFAGASVLHGHAMVCAHDASHRWRNTS